MKKITSLLALCFGFIVAEAQTAFRNTYPNVTISCVSQTSDGGYIIAGFSTTYTIGAKDIVLIKTDNGGAVAWSTTFGNNVNAGGEDIPGNVVEIPGGAGYYVAGQFWNQGNNTYEVYVLKTDTLGTRLWSKTLYNGGYDRGMRVENDGAGGCFIIGWVGNSSRGYTGRLDAAGNLLWQNSVAWISNAWVLQSGRRTADGGLICAGYDNEQGAYEMFLLKMTNTGAIAWQRGFAMGTTFNFAYDVCNTSDNGFMLAGGSAGINLARIDSLGTLQWSTTYLPAGPRAYSVRQCTDNGYIVLANESNDQYLMKTDSTGNVLWTSKYSGGYFINTVEQTTDGGFVFAMGSDVIKTDASGLTGCSDVSHTFTSSALTLITRTPVAYTTGQFANNTAADGSTSPVINPTLCITTDVDNVPGVDDESGIENVVVYDMLGKQVGTWQQEVGKRGNEDLKLKPGIYFVQLITEKKMVTKKIAVVK